MDCTSVNLTCISGKVSLLCVVVAVACECCVLSDSVWSLQGGIQLAIDWVDSNGDWKIDRSHLVVRSRI